MRLGPKWDFGHSWSALCELELAVMLHFLLRSVYISIFMPICTLTGTSNVDIGSYS